MRARTLCICTIFVGIAGSCLAGESALNEKESGLAVTRAKARLEPVYTVKTQVDGNLFGRVRVAGHGNHRHTLAASITLSRSGNIVSRAETDESGYFQLVAVQPGQYTGTAVFDRFSSSFEVHALPFDEAAPPEEMILDVYLDPLESLEPPDEFKGVTATDPEKCPLCRGDVPIASSCGCSESRCGGFHGGGCCGHRPKWGLLGLAGLAGLVGLDDDDKIIRVVSPFKPHSH